MKQDEYQIWIWIAAFASMWLSAPIIKAVKKARGSKAHDTHSFIKSSWMETDVQLIYPRQARKNDLEGSVIVEIEYDKNGSVLSSKVARSSSHESLDKAAVEAASSSRLSQSAIENVDFTHRWKVTFKLENA